MHAGESLLEDLFRLLLVFWRDIGIEKAHGQAGDALVLQRYERLFQCGNIERRDFLAAAVGALGRFDYMAARQQVWRRRGAQVEGVVLYQAGDFEDVAIAFADDQRDPGAAVFEQGIQGDGGAMDKAADGRRRRTDARHQFGHAARHRA